MKETTEIISIDRGPIEIPYRSRVSASAINAFELCPKKYVLKYLDRRESRPQASVRLVLGNAIHHALQKFFGLPLENRSLEDLNNCLRSVWHLYRGEAGFVSRDEEAACGNEALALLARFYASFDVEVTPLAREEWIESMPLETGISGFGKVDRIDAPDDAGGLHVIDYKTGCHEIESTDLPNDRAAQLYLIGVADDFGEPVEAVRYMYLASGNESEWLPERDEIDSARGSLEIVTAEMLHARGMDATPGDHCRFCEFRRSCPEANATPLTDLEVPEGVVF